MTASAKTINLKIKACRINPPTKKSRNFSITEFISD